MNTKWLPKTSFVNIKRLGKVNWLKVIGLLGIGFFIAFLQANLRVPLRLPGWRGLTWLTPLVATRLSTSFFGAASVTSLSATGFSLLLGVRHNPFDWFLYLVVGELLDLAYHFNKQRRQKIWFWAIAAGLVHLIKPLSQTIVSAGGGWRYGALFVAGPFYPLMTHLVFGAIAGFLGAATVFWVKRLHRSQSQ
ncbi:MULTISPECIES: hypothetical protein [Nostocales]|uniref:Uncharacterized protein n=3 Tax=Nostocales TaxID=1161 RepID=A0A0C1N2U4_9CYAN|nr:hypothetical protein [Tolypothrix bouteillei]KAF3889906.1 hypothetical protein DA73_0400033880 [Tolypothrix bouteillei VB521301]